MVPNIKKLPDGRLYIPHRGATNNPVSFSVSYDAGKTWPETTISDLLLSEYESLVIVNNTKAIAVFARDTSVDKVASIVYAASKDITQFRQPDATPPFAFDAVFDGRELNHDGSTTTDKLGIAWTQSEDTREPYRAFEDGYREGVFARFNATDGCISTGGLTDYEYLHDGSPFTVGISYNVKVPSANTPLIATCEFSGSPVGLTFYASSGARLNLRVYDGSAPEAVVWASAANLTANQDWNLVVLVFDGTDYKVYINSNLVATIAAGTTYASGAHANKLSIAKADDASVIAADELDVSRAFVMDSALDLQGVRTATLWLDK